MSKLTLLPQIPIDCVYLTANVASKWFDSSVTHVHRLLQVICLCSARKNANFPGI